MKQKYCVTSGNLTFSEKEVFCNIYSCSVNLLDKYTSDFIKNEHYQPNFTVFHFHVATWNLHGQIPLEEVTSPFQNLIW